MTAQQAAAGNGFQRGHKKQRRRGCGDAGTHRRDGERQGVICRTIRGVAESFGIPRKGVLVAWILILVFSFPVGVLLFGLAWAYVHHPDWFNGIRGKVRGAKAGMAPAQGTAQERPTMGVDFEEPWMEELREKFDDLERRTGSMEGYVASGDYRLSSEFEKMKKDAAEKNGRDVSGKPSDGTGDASGQETGPDSPSAGKP